MKKKMSDKEAFEKALAKSIEYGLGIKRKYFNCRTCTSVWTHENYDHNEQRCLNCLRAQEEDDFEAQKQSAMLGIHSYQT